MLIHIAAITHTQATLRDLFQVKPDVQVSVQSHLASDSQVEAEDVSLSSKCIEDVSICCASYQVKCTITIISSLACRSVV